MMTIGKVSWVATVLVVAAVSSCRENELAMPSAPLPPLLPPTPPVWDNPPAPVWDNSPVQTDALVYTLRRLPDQYRAIVIATFANRTGAPVYFERCTAAYTTPMFWMARSGADSTRKFFVDWGWGCHGNVPPGVVLPGAAVTVAAPFGSVDQPNMRPPLQPGDLTGLFRIYLYLCTRAAGSALCTDARPWSDRISNVFEIRY